MKVLPSVLLFAFTAATGQGTNVFPPDTKAGLKYLFYFHGGIVTVAGDNAINPAMPEWGRYEYSGILDSLQKRGFFVISEIRRQGVSDSFYTHKLVNEIDSLLDAEVPVENILIVGASAGTEIVLHAASELKNTSLRFVIMGGCWPDTHKQYTDMPLYGHFLSIIESSDPHGTCAQIFKRRHVSSFQEVKLKTGLSHGFLYRGLKEWIDPMMRWFNAKR